MSDSLSRRTFIGFCGGTAAAAVLPVVSVTTGPAPWELPTFTPLVGETFIATGADGTAVRLVLRRADGFGKASTNNDRGERVCRGFSLVFEASAPDAIPSGVYLLAHPAVQPSPVLLNEVFSRSHPALEAVFSRMVTA